MVTRALMMETPGWVRRAAATTAALTVLVLAAACGDHSPAKLPPPGSMAPDQFLFERGTDALGKKHWLEAREYLRRLVDQYPQSQYRADAKLGVGDTYLGENHIDADILAINQYKEFLQYFPLNAKADYAQYQICVAQSRQILSAERDQSATVEALRQIDTFLTNFTTSTYRPAVEKLKRQAQDRLSDHEFRVGLFHFRIRAYLGAIDRFTYLLSKDPGYTDRDQVYYYLAEAYFRSNLKPAALPYFNKLIEEFPNSKYVKDAKQRLAEINVKR